MSNTKVAPTIHGDVEYETVECASCEREVAKEDAQRFYIGTVQERRDWSTLGKTVLEFESRSLRGGWACDYCAERGPIQYPQHTGTLSKITRQIVHDPIAMMLAALVVGVIVFGLTGVIVA